MQQSAEQAELNRAAPASAACQHCEFCLSGLAIGIQVPRCIQVLSAIPAIEHTERANLAIGMQALCNAAAGF